MRYHEYLQTLYAPLGLGPLQTQLHLENAHGLLLQSYLGPVRKRWFLYHRTHLQNVKNHRQKNASHRRQKNARYRRHPHRSPAVPLFSL